MKIFKKYDLVDYNSDDKSEDAIITLYPSLQFGWDMKQFQTVSGEYIKNSKAEEGIQDLDSDEDEEGI